MLQFPIPAPVPAELHRYLLIFRLHPPEHGPTGMVSLFSEARPAVPVGKYSQPSCLLAEAAGEPNFGSPPARVTRATWAVPGGRAQATWAVRA